MKEKGCISGSCVGESISEQPSKPISQGDQYGGLSFVYSWVVKNLELYFLFISMTDQHSCVWYTSSKPAVHCCSVHLFAILLYTAVELFSKGQTLLKMLTLKSGLHENECLFNVFMFLCYL